MGSALSSLGTEAFTREHGWKEFAQDTEFIQIQISSDTHNGMTMEKWLRKSRSRVRSSAFSQTPFSQFVNLNNYAILKLSWSQGSPNTSELTLAPNPSSSKSRVYQSKRQEEVPVRIENLQTTPERGTRLIAVWVLSELSSAMNESLLFSWVELGEGH